MTVLFLVELPLFSVMVHWMLLCLTDLQVGVLESRRNQVLQGILRVQKCFRGHQARRFFHEVKGVITLQSCSASYLFEIHFLYYNLVYVKFIQHVFHC